MKIMLINPDSGMDAAALSFRCQILKEYVGPDVELAMVCPTLNNLELDSALDAALADGETVQAARPVASSGEAAAPTFAA